MIKSADPKDFRQKAADQEADLEHQYQGIGISAVAAAVCYQGDRRTTTDVSASPEHVSPKRDWTFSDAA
jgi:hypothetical protein